MSFLSIWQGNALVGVFDDVLTSVTEQGVRTDFGFDSGRVSCFAQSSTAVAVAARKIQRLGQQSAHGYSSKTLENLYSADIGAEAVSLSLFSRQTPRPSCFREKADFL